jgi:hypothetical protein
VIIDLTERKMQVAAGGIVAAPALLLLLELVKLAAQHYWGG